VADVQRLERELALVEAEEKAALRGIDTVGTAGYGPSFMQDSAALEDLRQRVHGPTPLGDINLGTLISRDRLVARWGQVAAADWRVADSGFGAPHLAVSELETPNTAASRSRFYDIVPQLRRPLTLLDVIPTQPMDVGSFDYEREEGSLATAAEKAEGAVAAQADMVLTPATATAKTISHYYKTRREQLADMATLASVLNTRLTYGVRLRLEGQILSGDGIGENLLGVLNTSGIGAPVSGAGDSHNTDMVARGIATVMAAGAVPTAVVLNPNNAIEMAMAKTSGSGQRLDSDGAFAAALLSQLWGVPTVLNLGIPDGTGLVADFTLGATLFVREGVNVRVSDSDQDDFIRGRTTAYGSGRFALAIWNAACFAEVPLGFPV
jgi:hypothetical protein